MAEFLFKALDHSMPTVEEFKAIIRDTWVPEAEAVLQKPEPDPETIAEALTLKRFFGQAERARQLLALPQDHPEALKGGRIALAAKLVTDFEEAFPPEDRAVTFGAVNSVLERKAERDWAEGIRDVVSQKSDEVIAQELAEKERGCYKLGDIVEVREDGCEWGREEARPPAQGGKFFRIRMDKMDVGHARRYQEGGDHAAGQLQRLYRIAYEDLPAEVQATLQAEGYFISTWSEMRGFIVQKSTGARQ